ncbi:MAG: GNAT family N-acetyltransferase [Candidatus Binataceae bacterium]|nr:GNAT family N-acetyltransferase [Candidatus Binataceae bacterium]
MNPPVAVSILFPPLHDAAAALLGRAFADDPLIATIVGPTPDAAARVRQMTRLFGVMVAENRRAGQPIIGVLDEGRVAAAAILEQIARPDSSVATVLHGLFRLPELVGAIGFGGVGRAVAALDTLLKHRPAEPHIYLNVLGVDPSCQRRHFGRALLDYLRAAAAARPDLAGVYLETATAANVAYYTAAGYRTLGEFAPLGVRMWRMLQPRTP